MIKTKKIKDNIHGYIYYSNLESHFISHKLVLRLHYVRQNGAAYLTYPSIRVHRYEHSLGAMHLAGQLLLSAIRFSTDQEGLFREARKAILEILGHDSIKDVREHLENSAHADQIQQITKDGLYHLHSVANIKDDECLVTLLLFQAIRVAMLVHDIGHPPFSHTFEMGLKQLGVPYDDHERVGLDLLKVIVADIKGETRTVMYHYAAMVERLVNAIIDKKNPHYLAMKGIADLVSGDVDADRLDYVRRDALSGGLSTNSYDVGRLFDALKLVPNDEGGGIKLVYHAAALSTLEAFFGMRFHLYRWMLWHHSVIMQNMVLVSITHSISELSKLSCRSVSAVAKEIMDIAIDASRRHEYWYFTDSYLMTKLAEIRNRLPTDVDSAYWRRVLYVDLETFLFRKKDFIRPFWKRPDDYSNFARMVTGEELVTQDGGAAASLNRMLHSAFAEVRKEIRETIEKGELSKTADNGDYHSREFCRRIERVANAGLPAGAGEVRAYYLAKFKPAPEGMELYSGKELYPLEVLSPTIKALDVAWGSLPQLWLFLDRCTAVTVEDKGGLRAQNSGKEPADVLGMVAGSIRTFLGIGAGHA